MPGGYGVVTLPMSVRQGINCFLEGFIPSENMRFRDYNLNFKIGEAQVDKSGAEESKASKDNKTLYQYPSMTKTLGPFKIEVEGG